MMKNPARLLLFGGLTAVFVGYFAVWLPGPGVGLTFIGLEIGEWIKFLGVGGGRNYFYLPPITLGLILALLSLTWPAGRWQNWVVRGMGVGVSLLSFPAVDAVRFEPSSEWLLRLVLIGVVTLTALGSGVLARRQRRSWLPWMLIALLGLLGAVAPTRIYFQIRPLVSQVFGLPVGIGPGVWLNGVGHLLVTAVSLFRLRSESTPIPADS